MNKLTQTGKRTSLAMLVTLLSVGLLADPAIAASQNADPLKVLMITGGGPWQDYATQKDQIEEGLLERLSNIEIKTDYEGEDTTTFESTDFKFSRHLEKDWAAEFDVVIYNHCNLQVKDEAYTSRLTARI